MSILSHQTDIDEFGKECEKERPSGAHGEHLQPAKTINGAAQRAMRVEARRRKMAARYESAVNEQKTIANILHVNRTCCELLCGRRYCF